MKITEINAPVQPDTYEASMLIKQAIRAGKYSIQIHNLLSNDQEVEAWVQKKIDLATNYVKKIAKYLELEGQYGEDAGEGHMAKSQLYHSAKYAMQIAQTVRPGQDIEAWVQTKMNRAVDMLDAVYHYEDYQRMNPYREELGDEHAKHGEIIKNKIDEILEFELPVDDIETKPGMFNILKRRVTEFEKKMAKQSVREATMDDKLKNRLEQIAINNGAIATDYMGGSLFVKFTGQTAKLKADKTHVLIRKNVKHHHPDTGVNMFRVGDEFVYDFVPLDAEKPDADHTNEGSRMPSSMIKHKQKLDAMSPEELNDLFQRRADQHNAAQTNNKKTAKELARSQELRYGKNVAAMAPYSRHIQEYNVNTPFKRKILNKLRGPVNLVKQKQDKEAYQDKMQALQNISKDPNTSYDQQLKDKLSARLDKLRTTGL